MVGCISAPSLLVCTTMLCAFCACSATPAANTHAVNRVRCNFMIVILLILLVNSLSPYRMPLSIQTGKENGFCFIFPIVSGKDNQIVNIFCGCFYSKKLFLTLKSQVASPTLPSASKTTRADNACSPFRKSPSPHII